MHCWIYRALRSLGRRRAELFCSGYDNLWTKETGVDVKYKLFGGKITRFRILGLTTIKS